MRSDRDVVVGTARVATETRRPLFKKRMGAIGIVSFFAGLGILLFASGAFFIGGFNSIGISRATKATIPRSPSAASATVTPVFEVRNLDVYIPRDAVAGKLFVITGTVRNLGNVSSRGIRLRAILFGKNDKVLMEKTSIAGNYLDKGSVSYMARPAIESHQAAVRYEPGTGNHDIPPGNSLPFIVVCFDPPGTVESYEVLATNAEL